MSETETTDVAPAAEGGTVGLGTTAPPADAGVQARASATPVLLDGTEECVSAARRVAGQATVPGELLATEQAVLLGALSSGESRVRNAPPGIDRLIGVLGTLGVQGVRLGRDVKVLGVGLQGLRAPAAPVDLQDLGDVGVALLGLLAGQSFATRVVPPAASEAQSLADLLRAMGARLEAAQDGTCVLGGSPLTGTQHAVQDPEGGTKLGLLLAGLCASGVTSMRESAAPRHRVERLLRERGVAVERHRQAEGEEFVLSVCGGQEVQAAQIEVAGDLRLAYPLLVPALVRRGSEVVVRRVALRSAERGLLDLLRQIGAQVSTTELGGDLVDLTATFSLLKATRVAGQRAERIAAQAPLLAVLATQIVGEFVIRDVPGWRQDEPGPLGTLFEVLKQMGARVGEYPEGLVIKGGQPLHGARVSCAGSPELAMALGTAGLLAHGQMAIADTECMSRTFPDYFAVIRTLAEKPKEKKR